MYKYTAEKLATYLESTEGYLRREIIADRVKRSLLDLAREFEDERVISAAHQPQAPGEAYRGGPYRPLPRDDRFNEAVAFLDVCRHVISDRREFDEQVAANEAQSIDVLKVKILAVLRTSSLPPHASMLFRSVPLGDRKMLEALMELEHEKLIETSRVEMQMSLDFTVCITALGRARVDGRDLRTPETPTPVFNQTFQGPVANAGSAGVVTQINHGLVQLPADVRAALDRVPAGPQQAAAYESASRSHPNRALLEHLAATIEEMVSSIDGKGEIGAQARVWRTSIENALAFIPL